MFLSTKGTGNPIDVQYAAIGTDIQILPPDSREWELISRMIQDTHGPTHTQFSLRLVQAFTVQTPFYFSLSINSRLLKWVDLATKTFGWVLEIQPKS